MKKPTKKSPRRAVKKNRVVRPGGKYKGRVPRHVKEFKFKNKKGQTRFGYVSRISGRRISSKKIRSRRDEQALRERFPNINSTRKIKGFLDDWRADFSTATPAERGFIEDRYKDLFNYLKAKAPHLLPTAQLAENISDFTQEETGENETIIRRKNKRKKKLQIHKSSKSWAKYRRSVKHNKIRKRRARKP